MVYLEEIAIWPLSIPCKHRQTPSEKKKKRMILHFKIGEKYRMSQQVPDDERKVGLEIVFQKNRQIDMLN